MHFLGLTTPAALFAVLPSALPFYAALTAECVNYMLSLFSLGWMCELRTGRTHFLGAGYSCCFMRDLTKCAPFFAALAAKYVNLSFVVVQSGLNVRVEDWSHTYLAASYPCCFVIVQSGLDAFVGAGWPCCLHLCAISPSALRSLCFLLHCSESESHCKVREPSVVNVLADTTETGTCIHGRFAETYNPNKNFKIKNTDSTIMCRSSRAPPLGRYVMLVDPCDEVGTGSWLTAEELAQRAAKLKATDGSRETINRAPPSMRQRVLAELHVLLSSCSALPNCRVP